MTSRISIVLILALTATGCQSYGSAAAVPARIIDPDAASRAALQEAINTAFGTEVLLADTALTDSSLLTIERNPSPTLDNPNPQGRIMEDPFQLRLYKSGNDCILVDERNGTRYPLAATSCEAE
ncbi:MAG: hypothetical protein ACR2QS_03770 [Woeseiaceae bacterium]